MWEEWNMCPKVTCVVELGDQKTSTVEIDMQLLATDNKLFATLYGQIKGSATCRTCAHTSR